MKKFITFNLLFIILIFPKIVFGNNMQVYGHGTFDCSIYVQDYQIASPLYFEWVDDYNRSFTDDEYGKFLRLHMWHQYLYGFASGTNGNNRMINGNLYTMPDGKILAIELNNYCNQNPSEAFFMAVIFVLEKYKNN